VFQFTEFEEKKKKLGRGKEERKGCKKPLFRIMPMKNECVALKRINYP